MSWNRSSILAVFSTALIASVPLPAQSDSAATRGYIYGTVETSTGKTYRGLLRWGTEEAFWDDLFNSAKTDLSHLEKHADRTPSQRSRIKVLGVTIGYRWDEITTSRVFTARFGDIFRIEPGRGERVRVTTKDGTVWSLEGASNDVGATVTIQDDSLGEVRLEWESIERIEFAATPSSVAPGTTRLYGTLVAGKETFEGFIQWDSEECVSTDKLDGESEDGDLSIQMGKIRSIERHDSDGAWVELKDGRRLLLEGTNDVDESIRGIYVETEKVGRVKVPWNAFRRVDFKDHASSGKGYDEYRPSKILSGTVTDLDGQAHSGHVVFDLDEERGFEMLDGTRDDIEYIVPLERVRAIEPLRGSESKITLDNRIELVLGDTQDVSESNSGVLVQRAEGPETFLPWQRVKRIELETAGR